MRKARTHTVSKPRLRQQATARRQQRGHKQAFILGLPDLSAKEVVLAGQRAGVHFRVAYVYLVRSREVEKSVRAESVGRRGIVFRSPHHRASHFTSLAIRLGIGRAEKLLARMRRQFRAV